MPPAANIPFSPDEARQRHSRILRPHLDDDVRAFIESVTLMFVGSVGADGQVDVSPKGGAAGFVRALDTARIAWGEMRGNKMYMTGSNLQETGRVGLCFIDPFNATIVRVNGVATLQAGDFEGLFPGAEYCVVVRAEEIFPNCGRSLKPLQQQMTEVLGQALARLGAG